MKIHRLVVVALFAALVSACGFHLRGEAQLSPAMQELVIEGADALSPLGRDLRKALTRSGARVVESGAQGACGTAHHQQPVPYRCALGWRQCARQ